MCKSASKIFDIEERTFEFSVAIINFLRNVEASIAIKPMISQLSRSAMSIGANITEAKCSSSKKEFKRYYEIALKSANETKYWLRLFKATNNHSGLELDNLGKEAKELSNILGASIITMKNKRNV